MEKEDPTAKENSTPAKNSRRGRNAVPPACPMTPPRYGPWPRHMHGSTVGPGLHSRLSRPGGEEACRRVCSAILQSGYDGTVSMEPDPPELTPGAAKAALAMMRRAFAEG